MVTNFSGSYRSSHPPRSKLLRFAEPVRKVVFAPAILLPVALSLSPFPYWKLWVGFYVLPKLFAPPIYFFDICEHSKNEKLFYLSKLLLQMFHLLFLFLRTFGGFTRTFNFTHSACVSIKWRIFKNNLGIIFFLLIFVYEWWNYGQFKVNVTRTFELENKTLEKLSLLSRAKLCFQMLLFIHRILLKKKFAEY